MNTIEMLLYCAKIKLLYEVRIVSYDIQAAFKLIRFITTKIENTLQLMQNGVFSMNNRIGNQLVGYCA